MAQLPAWQRHAPLTGNETGAGAGVITDAVTDSPLSAGEIRAAAETHQELGPDYRDAVIESFVERVGREIDARVDARLARSAGPQAPPVRRVNVQATALGSIALGIPITAIVLTQSSQGSGFWELVVVWLAIAAINIAYATRLRPPGGHG